MTLSIVVPCYNEEKLISKNFEAILDQSVLPEQVIFVNNNSTDNSRHIAEQYQSKFEKLNVDFRIIDVREQGIISARRAGWGAATSDLIGSIDTDSIIDKNWVRSAKETFSQNKNIVAISGPVLFYNKPNLWHLKLVYLMYSLSNYVSTIWTNNCVFKRSSYHQVGQLNDHQNFFRELKLKYTYEDNFLSEKFKLIGEIKFCWNLKAKAFGRGGFARDIDSSINFFRIKKYIKNNFKPQTI